MQKTPPPTTPPSEPIIQGVLFMADEMLAAGVEELKSYDPEKERPIDVVARIYTAMEIVRIMIEHMLRQEISPVPADKLN